MKTSFIILLVALCMIAAVMSSPATEELAFSDSVANVNAFDDQNINKKIIKLIKIKKILKLITPSSAYKELPLQLIDTENYLVSYRTNEIGKFSIFIKFNEFDLSKKPLIVTVAEKSREFVLPVFNSDSRKVSIKGLGIQQVILNVKNEFTVDASAAGNNILFVSVGGPSGQCDEVYIRHMGQNIYNVYYRVRDVGEYRIVVKYGSDHIPGSPFHLRI
ncbi:unnamed protein product [Diamesa tonsa]